MILLESSKLRKPTKDEKSYFNLINSDLVSEINTDDGGLLILTGTKVVVMIYTKYGDEHYLKQLDTKSKAKQYAESFLTKIDKVRTNSELKKLCKRNKFEYYN